MANVIDAQVMTWDTIGVYVPGPIETKKILIWPSAAGDGAEFRSCRPKMSSKKDSQTVTVAATNQIQSTGNFLTTDVSPGDVIQIVSSNSLNVGWYIVNTRDSNDQVTVYGTPLTNESGKIYSWIVWKGFCAGKIASQATNKLQDQLDFGVGYKWPMGLGLIVLSASACLYLYR